MRKMSEEEKKALEAKETFEMIEFMSHLDDLPLAFLGPFILPLTIVFIVLKLTDVIDWDWIWVLSPFWGDLIWTWICLAVEKVRNFFKK